MPPNIYSLKKVDHRDDDSSNSNSVNKYKYFPQEPLAKRL